MRQLDGFEAALLAFERLRRVHRLSDGERQNLLNVQRRVLEMLRSVAEQYARSLERV